MPDSPDLTACDREPIHIPGAIQPHGLLLAADPASGLVVRAAGDASRLLGLEGSPLGRPAAELIGRGLPEGASGRTTYAGSIPGASGELDLLAHRSGGLLILELEPAAAPRLSAARALGEMQALSIAVERTHDVARACEAAARAVRRFTGYDRVMVYRFLEDGAGRVVAEDKADGMSPFLHHHFPASDIPRQARALYLRNLIRLIPDAGYTPAPVEGDDPAAPLDMTDCVLRSVSPIHVQYLKNMGVAASASVSLVVDGALWGLIALHNDTPRLIPFEVREMCVHAGQILAQTLKGRADEAAHSEVLTLARRREEILPAIAQAGILERGLDAAELQALLPCDGAAFFSDGKVVLSGVTPGEEAVRALALWHLREEAPAACATASLSRNYPAAIDFAAKSSGLLALTVRRDPALVLLWFRAEHVETVEWAGNPHKAATGEAGALSPRASFDAWRETVRSRARRWTTAEVEAGHRFADGLREIDRQNRLADLNRQLRATLAEKDESIAQKDLMMREAHHRVQNSLQLVASMLQIQERDLADAEAKAQFELARQRVMAVAMVHRRLWRADQIDTINLETFFAELGEGLEQSWGPAWKGKLTLNVSPVRVATSQAVTLAIVTAELVTNAVKHAYRGEAGPVEVAVRQGGGQTLALSVCDQGVGAAAFERPGSFGSRLTQALVKQLKGEIEISDTSPGTRVRLTVPLMTSGH